MKLGALLLASLISLLLAGCGGGGNGGGGSHTVSPVQASFTIDWPARSRDLSNPLTSSLSAVVVFPKADGHGGDVTMTVDRDSSKIAAYAGTYSPSQGVVFSAGQSMTATFYAAAGGQGAVVGTATSFAVLKGSTVQFSSIVFQGTIKRVTVVSNSLLLGSGQTQLTFSATDASSNAVAVSPGSAIWSLGSGSSYLSLTPDGLATPQQVGSAQVTVSVDGIASAPATISILSGPVSNATFQISWPARSRGALTHSLSSALSVQVVFKNGQVGGGDLAMNVDRDSTKTSAYVGTYTLPQPIEPTCQSMTAAFYASAGEQGAMVGTAAAQVSIGSSAVDLASVVVSGTIKSVAVIPPGDIPVGASAEQLQFTATDGNGAAVAVTAGSAIWSVVNGQANATLTPDGAITGLKGGAASVTVAVDNITSPTATIQLVSSPVTKIFGIDASDVAYDSNHNTLYVCATASSPVGASEVVPIDLGSGTVGAPFAAGTAPTNICVSSDGSELFAANQSGFFTRVPTSTRVVDLVWSMPAGLVPAQLLTLPNAPASFVAELTQPNYSDWPTRECVIYDGNVPRTNTPNLGIEATIDPTGTKIYGTDTWESPNLYFSASITSSGVSNVTSANSLELGAQVDLCYQNGVVATSGYVQMQFVNASSGNVLASSGNDAWYRYVAPSVGTNDIYLLSWSVLNNNQVIIQPYDVTSFLATTGAFNINGFQGSPTKMVAAGPRRVAFITNGNGSSDSVVVVNGLP